MVVLCLAALSSLSSRLHAQETDPLRLGESVVTRFAGVKVLKNSGETRSIINLDGIVASVIDLRRPGFAPDGRHWLNEPQRLRITARDMGQVFGIAIDDAEPANIYFTASAAFGQHRLADNSGWMEGMWGPNAGPGTIYRLSAANSYRPEVFATVKLNGRDNKGPALGNIVYDRWHKQLLVSDLETGMVHRFRAADGRDLGHFDHGVDGRAWFFDAPSGKQLSLKQQLF
jgi:hypothetical protein